MVMNYKLIRECERMERRISKGLREFMRSLSSDLSQNTQSGENLSLNRNCDAQQIESHKVKINIPICYQQSPSGRKNRWTRNISDVFTWLPLFSFNFLTNIQFSTNLAKNIRLTSSPLEFIRFNSSKLQRLEQHWVAKCFPGRFAANQTRTSINFPISCELIRRERITFGNELALWIYMRRCSE